MRARDLIDRFGREEEAFLRTEFVARVAPPGRVRVRIGGAVCEMSVRAPVEGVQVLRPRSLREAEIVRPATKAEAKKYLALFPRARLVAVFPHGKTWLGISAGTATVEGLVPIALADPLLQFQTALVRLEGAAFVFESAARPAEAAFLRAALQRDVPPESLQRKGLTPAERDAYVRALAFKQEMEKSVEERRLEKALRLAGADLVRFEARRDTFEVSYRVDGEVLTATVAQGDLTVLSSGICLSGRDRDFDLTSLVGVMRQHRREEEF